MTNSIQYRHRNCDRNFKPATFICQVPMKETLDKVLLGYTVIEQNFGMSLVNPKDNYCRKTGRSESLKQMKLSPMVFKKITFNNNNTRLIYHFQVLFKHDSGQCFFLDVGFSNPIGTNHVRFEFADFTQ